MLLPMKTFLKHYWLSLPVLLAVLVCVSILLMLGYPTFLNLLVGILTFFAILALSVSWIFLARKKEWKKFAVSFGLSAFIVLTLGVFSTFVAMSSPDGFGRSHPIPIDLKYNIPLKSADPFIYHDKDETAQVDSTDSNTWLQIWDDFGQGGIYKYDFYYGTLPAGEIFLKCFEVTDNYRLSEERLTEASKVEIPANSSFAKIVGKKEFVIYEGDFDDYYAARIEVWFRDAESGVERKLLEKIYRVEGWMR